jgi:hypothetical protein
VWTLLLERGAAARLDAATSGVEAIFSPPSAGRGRSDGAALDGVHATVGLTVGYGRLGP